MANFSNDLYHLAKKENGEISSEWLLVWNMERKAKFLIYCESNDVGSDAWRERNHLWDEQKKRLKALEDHLSFSVSTVRAKGADYGWDNFCTMRQRRNQIVHATRRQHLFQARDKSEVAQGLANAVNTLAWVVALSEAFERQLYSIPIFEDLMAGRRVNESWEA